VIYLIDYDWKQGRLIGMSRFAESDRETAQNARLALELDLLAQHLEREVVLLQAESESALRLTHQRYFLASDEASRHAAALTPAL
jgi:hypothetical protein